MNRPFPYLACGVSEINLASATRTNTHTCAHTHTTQGHHCHSLFYLLLCKIFISEKKKPETHVCIMGVKQVMFFRHTIIAIRTLESSSTFYANSI